MRPARWWQLAVLLGAALWAPARAAALVIQFDYTYDTAGFFTAHPEAKAILNTAAASLAGRLTNPLAEIPLPAGANTLAATFFNPATTIDNQPITLPAVPANTLIVYVGGADLGGSILAEAGPGGAAATGAPDWVNLVQARGQLGALMTPPAGFGPWGGSISFSTTFNWWFGAYGAVGPGYDFFSVAVHELGHELGHVLGIGTADSWTAQINQATHQFLGPAAVAAYGGPVPVTGDGGHWDASINLSTVAGVPQQAAMTPYISASTRKRFTVLDWAGLSDIGWTLAAPGDANGDGVVDVLDFAALARNYGGNGEWAAGDFNGDGLVNDADLALLMQAGGAAGGALPTPGAATPVPDPATGLLLVLVAPLLLSRPRRSERGARPPTPP